MSFDPNRHPSERLRKLRKELAVGQKVVALETGLRQPHISGFETGREPIHPAASVRIANFAARYGRIADAIFFLQHAGLSDRVLEWIAAGEARA